MRIMRSPTSTLSGVYISSPIEAGACIKSVCSFDERIAASETELSSTMSERIAQGRFPHFVVEQRTNRGNRYFPFVRVLYVRIYLFRVLVYARNKSTNSNPCCQKLVSLWGKWFYLSLPLSRIARILKRLGNGNNTWLPLYLQNIF